MRFETMAVHAAADPDPRTGALAAAIQMSTTFERAADGTFPSGFAYTRDANPNRKALETAMAEEMRRDERVFTREWRPRWR